MGQFLKVFRFAWRSWVRRPWLLGSAVFLLGAAMVLDIFLPVLAGRLVDSVAGAGSAGAGGAGTGGAVPGPVAVAAAWHALAWFILTGVAYHVARAVAFRIWIYHQTGSMGDMLREAFHRVQRFDSHWHADSFAGGTVRKITRGMWACESLGDTVFLGFFPTVCILVGVTVSLALRWPLVGLVVACIVVLHAALGIALATGYVAPANRVSNRLDSEIGATLADSITGNAAVKSFGAEQREDDRLGRVAGRWLRATRKAWARSENMDIVQSAILILLQLAMLGLVLRLWRQGDATPGGIAFAMSNYFLMHGILRGFGEHVDALQKATNEMEDIVRFAERPFGVADKPGAAAIVVTSGAVTFDRVTFGYRQRRRETDGARPALYRDFSLAIAPGERVALVGRSGSGKSTFVKLLQRLHDVEAGRIMIDGQNIADVTQASLRQAIAVVPQDPALFHRSLAENIAFGRPGADRATIEAAARQAGADSFIHALPAGYETLVGERGVKLSGGERQRIAIARAIVADAPLLVLDEATSSLDSFTETGIRTALEALMRARTTIVIAHRLATVRDADRVLVFEAGAVVEHGPPAVLLARSDSYYRALHHMQVDSLVQTDNPGQGGQPGPA